MQLAIYSLVVALTAEGVIMLSADHCARAHIEANEIKSIKNAFLI
jgi:hypothetical protein